MFSLLSGSGIINLRYLLGVLSELEGTMFSSLTGSVMIKILTRGSL